MHLPIPPVVQLQHSTAAALRRRQLQHPRFVILSGAKKTQSSIFTALEEGGKKGGVVLRGRTSVEVGCNPKKGLCLSLSAGAAEGKGQQGERRPQSHGAILRGKVGLSYLRNTGAGIVKKSGEEKRICNPSCQWNKGALVAVVACLLLTAWAGVKIVFRTIVVWQKYG